MASAPPAPKVPHWTEAIKAENEQLKVEIDKLREEIAAWKEISTPQEDKSYELVPIMREVGGTSKPSTLSIYDGLSEDPPSFFYHEAISFREDSAFDEQMIRDRALASITRAITTQRVGLGCSNLPPFEPEMKLEVIVQVLPLPQA